MNDYGSRYGLQQQQQQQQQCGPMILPWLPGYLLNVCRKCPIASATHETSWGRGVENRLLVGSACCVLMDMVTVANKQT